MIIDLLKRNRNYRYLFLGRLATNAGDSLYVVASAWIVFSLSQNVFLSGIAYALGSLPSSLSFLLNPIIDKYEFKKILVVSQVLQIFLISIIPLTHYFGILNAWILLIVIPIASLLNSLAYYAENSLISNLVQEDSLTVANSGMSLAYQGTDLLFSSIAGFAISLFGAIGLFIIDCLTFILSSILFSRIKAKNKRKQIKIEEGYFDNLRDGYREIRQSIIWPITLSTSVVNFFFGASLAIIPAFSSNLGGPVLYGLFLAGLSVGILVGSLLAPKFEKFSIGLLIPICFCITGIFWLFFVSVSWIPTMIMMLFFASIPIGISNVLLITLPQKIINKDKIMKVFSIQGSINTFGMPLGGIIGGYIAQRIGIMPILISTGISFLLFTLYWCTQDSLRLIPDMSSLKPANSF